MKGAMAEGEELTKKGVYLDRESGVSCKGYLLEEEFLEGARHKRL